MKKLLIKYKDILLYGIFGVLTTLTNITCYWLLSKVLHLAVVPSSIIAFVISVLFAFVTNRKWVFESESNTKKEIAAEVVKFFGCRLVIGALDTLIMFLFVDVLHFNDMLIKIISNIIVIILNFVASKLIVFVKKSR